MAVRRPRTTYKRKEIRLTTDEITQRKIYEQYNEVEKLYNKFNSAVATTLKYMLKRKTNINEINMILEAPEDDVWFKPNFPNVFKSKLPEFNGYSTNINIDMIKNKKIYLIVSTKLILKMDVYKEYVEYYESNGSQFDYITIGTSKYALTEIKVPASITKEELTVGDDVYTWKGVYEP